MKAKILEDGSLASTGHKKKKKVKEPPGFLMSESVDQDVKDRVAIERKIETYAYQIRQEAQKLAKLTDEISSAYSKYAESDQRIDDKATLHNGLANMLKLIEVQTTTKLRIKKMQTSILQIISSTTDDDELPYAIQEIIREVNVNFLDSKLVRAYGEIAKVMKEDSELANTENNEIRFVKNGLTSELEEMDDIKACDTRHVKESEDEKADS